MTDAPEHGCRLARLSGWQWRVLALSPAILALTWLRLRTRGYSRTLAAAAGPNRDREGPADQLAMARATAYALDVACKYGPWRPRCLLRSLTLGWFLAHRGIPYELRIGLPRGGDPSPGAAAPVFAAHAWVELDGVVLNDHADVGRRYRPFTPRSGPA